MIPKINHLGKVLTCNFIYDYFSKKVKRKYAFYDYKTNIIFIFDLDYHKALIPMFLLKNNLCEFAHVNTNSKG